MRRYTLAILGLLALALFTVACGESDLGITTKVKSRLDTDRNVNAVQVQVMTQNKVVTLSGAVESPAAKERAVAVARRVEGVTDVVNNLTVSTSVAAMPAPGAEAAADTAITQAVKQKLQTQPETVTEKIDVDRTRGS